MELQRLFALTLLALLCISCEGSNVLHLQTGVGPKPSNTELQDTLVVLWGQSNAAGFNNVPNIRPYWVTTNPGTVWYWAEDSGSYFSGAGSANADGTIGNAFIEVGLYDAPAAKAPMDIGMLRALIQKGISASSVRVTQGSTSIANDWQPDDLNPPHLYQVLRDETRAAIASASLSLSANFRMLWVSDIGENDANNETNANNYAQNWINIYEQFLIDFAGYRIDPVLIRLNDNTNRTFTAEVIAQQELVPSLKPEVRVFNPSYCAINADGLHYEPQSYQSQGVGVANLDRPNLLQVARVYSFSTTKSFDGPSGTGAVGDTVFTVLAYVVKLVSGSFQRTHQILSRLAANSNGFQFLGSAPTGGGNVSLDLIMVNTDPTNETVSVDLTLEEAVVSQVAFTRNGTAAQAYLNGAASGAPGVFSVGYTPASTAQARIGRQSSGTEIDEIAILAVLAFDGTALSAEQIADAWEVAKMTGEYGISGATTHWDAREAGGQWYDRIAKAKLTINGAPLISLSAEEYAP